MWEGAAREVSVQIIHRRVQHLEQMFDRRRLASAMAALACAALLLPPSSASAQDYPTHPVKLIVPFAPGGPADVYARVVGQRLQERFGQPFVVEDRPGGGSLIGTDAVAKSAADGYTLLVMSNTHTVNETLFANKPFQLLRDFVPVAPLNQSDLVLAVHPSLPVKSVRDLIELARAQPHALNYASSGPGTPYHMAGELFKSMAGVDIVHIPYKGSSNARTDLIGGQVQMMFDAITTMAPQAQAGKVRVLASTGRERSAVMPEVPTLAEAGVPGYDATIWLGVMAPTGTPAAIVNKLNSAIRSIVTSAEIKSTWIDQGARPIRMSPDEFGQFLRDDISKWAAVVKRADIKPD